jgi:hypothetical protein
MGILTLIGCGTPKLIVSQWNNPAYSSPSFKRMMIGGLAGETSIRRNFEDEFAAQLRAQGIDALPSYRYIPEAENIDEARLKQAAREAGAEAAIIARSVSVEQKTELGPSYYPTPAFGFFGRHIGATWYGLYGAPSVQRYNVYTSETTLHDIPKNEVVWTATVQTTDPNDVNKAIKNYVAAVIKALEEKNLLGKR